MRHRLAYLALAALTLVACGSDGDDTTATTSTPRGARAPVDSPIELGFVTTGVSNAASFGVDPGVTLNEAAVVETLVAALNAAGGLAGREIVPVIAETDTGSATWDADFAAACSTFTEDHDVAAVLGYVFGQFDSLEACLADAGVPHISTTFAIPDAEELAQRPLLISPSAPSIERRSIAKIDGAVEAGILTDASKIGVVIDACPSTQRAWTDTVLPHLEEAGLTVASEFETACAHGADEAAAEAGRLSSLVLQLRDADVDQVLIIGVSEAPPLFLISNVAEGQGYRPGYIVSSLAQTGLIGAQIPAAQAANVHGFGWSPVNDVAVAKMPAPSAAASRCLDLLASQGIVPVSTADHTAAFATCDAVFLYEQALEATEGSADGAAVVTAIEGLGDGYVSAANLDGRASFGPDRHDGPAQIRAFSFDESCTCFAYDDLTLPMS